MLQFNSIFALICLLKYSAPYLGLIREACGHISMSSALRSEGSWFMPWKEYPQVRKTGVDAVHEKLPTEGLYQEEM